MPEVTRGDANPGLTLCLTWGQGSAGSYFSFGQCHLAPFLKSFSQLSSLPPSALRGRTQIKTRVLQIRLRWGEGAEVGSSLTGHLLCGLDKSSALFRSHFSICRVKMRSASQTGREGVELLQGVQVPGEMPDPSLLPWGQLCSLEASQSLLQNNEREGAHHRILFNRGVVQRGPCFYGYRSVASRGS